MNVSSECVDNFHYNQLELLLLILVCNAFMYVMFRLFWENVVPIGHGNSFRLVLESHGKSLRVLAVLGLTPH